jgi:flagellar hook-basal body complex protein FliE
MVDGKAINASIAYAKALSSQVDMGNGANPLSEGVNGPSFAELLQDAGKEAINEGRTSEKVSLQALTQDTGLAEIVTAVSNAEASLETVVAVRDRVIQAYQDIIKMPI